MGEPTPVEKVWGHLGLQEMPTQASTEHSKVSLREPPSLGGGSEVAEEEPNSPMQPQNLIGADSEGAPSEGISSADSEPRGGGGGGQAQSLYATPPVPHAPPGVLKDSGVGAPKFLSHA